MEWVVDAGPMLAPGGAAGSDSPVSIQEFVKHHHCFGW